MLPDDTRSQARKLMSAATFPTTFGPTVSGNRRTPQIAPGERGPAKLVNRRVLGRAGRWIFMLYGAIALAAVVGVQKSRAAPGQPNSSAAQAAATPEDQRLEVTLDGSAVRSRLVVRSVGKDNDARKVVILGRPTGVQDIPEYNPPSRVDMLPRELVRQAVLIAARDELGLATRDQVIDETPAEAPTGDGGAFEVASFIRDNRSYEITGTPHTERSKPERCSMHSAWSHAARIAHGASGTGRSPWRFSAGTAMRWPTSTLRRRSQKSKARRRHRTGSMSSTPSAVMTRRSWPACKALKKSSRLSCAWSPWHFRAGRVSVCARPATSSCSSPIVSAPTTRCPPSSELPPST